MSSVEKSNEIPPSSGDEQTLTQDLEREGFVRNKRKYLRGRITRTIKRLRDAVSKKEKSRVRLYKELEQLRRDYDTVREYNEELYNFVEDEESEILDKWEDELTENVFEIEEEVEIYLSNDQNENSTPTASGYSQTSTQEIPEVSTSSLSNSLSPIIVSSSLPDNFPPAVNEPSLSHMPVSSSLPATVAQSSSSSSLPPMTPVFSLPAVVTESSLSSNPLPIFTESSLSNTLASARSTPNIQSNFSSFVPPMNIANMNSLTPSLQPVFQPSSLPSSCRPSTSLQYPHRMSSSLPVHSSGFPNASRPAVMTSHTNSHFFLRSLPSQSMQPAYTPTFFQTEPPLTSITRSQPGSSFSMSPTRSFDSWIDDLSEFQETFIGTTTESMSIADALYKLEASKDIPTITLGKFDGNPFAYVEFIERFRIHIHEKPHLVNDMRMVQLRMHVTGEAERAISGLGSQGIMYPTALKTLKEQFGQPSIIARAFINKLIKGKKIPGSDRSGLRDLSLDILNCMTSLQQINFFADINANENLRKIVMRLPDHLLHKWKIETINVRERGETPSLQHISAFIRKQVKAEFDPDFGDLQREMRNIQKDNRITSESKKGIHATQVQSQPRIVKCYICEDNHKVFNCPTLKDSSASERFGLVKTHKLCFSCLRKGHNTKECRSKKTCDRDGCKHMHHPLLHSDPPTASSVKSVLDQSGILPVVRVRFRSDNGICREGNVLLDSGASTTVIRQDFAKALGLQGRRERIDLAVVGGERVEESDSRRVRFHISSLETENEFIIEAHEIKKTILSIPPLNRTWLDSFEHLRGINFSHKAGPIDLILGIQYSHLHAEDEIRQGKPFEPVAKKSKIGWFVIGPDDKDIVPPRLSINFVQKVNMEKFYEFETLGIQAPNCNCDKEFTMSSDGKRTMELFEQSCHRDGNRYVIGLPWKDDPQKLPDNYLLAEKRLISLEKNLRKNPSKAKMYNDAIMEYERNGWSRKLSDDELQRDIKPVNYLPHHGIYRPEKTSTPLRIVFDPASQFQGTSLNSFLHKGPCLIGNLLGVLLRFREDHIGIAGDISKMYLQIRLPEQDVHVHRYLWRELDTQRKPDIYALERVTFGDKPSPDMASFVMLHIAKENEKDFPNAAVTLRRDRYMDDLIYSCSTSGQTIQGICELDQVLGTGSFKIKEWHCSDASVRDHLSQSSSTRRQTTFKSDSKAPSLVVDQDTIKEVNLDGESEVTTLGMGWKPTTDDLSFTVKDIRMEKLTKRSILSKISKLYDPLGLATAVTIKAKIALQDIWKAKKFDWDDPLPQELTSQWRKLFDEIVALRSVKIPRCLKPDVTSGKSTLHLFSDASLVAYGAAAYLLWPTPVTPEVKLVSAKARVAPLHQTTIPRLELMAALIAARLAKTIYEEFKEKPDKVILWTDSKIVLHWIRSDSAMLKPFVGVRVSEIQSIWNSVHWRYVPTSMNPADDLSRGLSVKEMNGRWMNGPAFLKTPEQEWPSESVETKVNDDEDPERKKRKSIYSMIPNPPFIDASSFSSWSRLLRVTAYCLRFVRNIKVKSRVGKPTTSMNGHLQPEELNNAENFWVIRAQEQARSKLEQFRDLTPFVEKDIIRVGGRISHAELSYDQIHPILLPADHHISYLIMHEIHIKSAHGGAERVLAESRQKFWIVRGRNLAKKIMKNCTRCKKLRQKPHSTLMANLPPERTRLFTPPFSVTGVDLFGPFKLKYGRNKSKKSWGAVFTCATVRAIHLEIVEDPSTPAFLQALRRFVSHHGWPSTFISDNGGCFVGTEAELKKLLTDGQSQLQDFALLHRARWIFTTPLAAHQGGIYESMVKQTKKALKVIVGNQILSWSEMSTVFAEVESLINGRPLGYVSNDANTPQPLTPNHFMLGRASPEVPQGPFEHTKNLRRRFQFVQTLVQQFWQRFVSFYVPLLMRRAKWQTKERQMAVGDIVLLVDYKVSRGTWDLGRVIKVYPGKDGIIRNVLVKTKNGEYQRPVQKCCIILEAKAE